MVVGSTVFSKQVSIILTLQAESTIILTCVAKHNGQTVAVMFVTQCHIPIFPNKKPVNRGGITWLKEIGCGGEAGGSSAAASESIYAFSWPNENPYPVFSVY